MRNATVNSGIKSRGNPRICSLAVAKKSVTIAVAGNPNSGKSTLINAIAGTRLHVGNWPGVTVEKKEAQFEYGDQLVKLVDLPGTYSLSPYTQEEIIARDYLVHERPDVIVNVVDATNLERNLYLTVQLMELGIPMIIALNIYDEAEQKGYKIDVKAMEQMLGATIIPTVATKKTGLLNLLEAALETAADTARRPKDLHYGEDVEAAASAVEKAVIGIHQGLVERYPKRWLALKIMESDERVLNEINLAGIDSVVKQATAHLEEAHESDIETLMADARYAQAAGLIREVLRKPEIKKKELTEKIDRFVLNRFLGIPIFLGAMWLMFKLTFDVSTPFVDWIDAMTAGPFKRWAEALLGLVGRLGLDDLPCNRRYHRRRRFRAGLRARHICHDVLYHLSGGQRIHGAGSIRDGPGDARHGPPWKIIYPDALGFRLQCSRCLCYADAGKSA